MMRFRSTVLLCAVALGAAGAAQAQAQAPAKRPLDLQAYELWDTIGSPALSADGAWALYSLIGYDRDGELRLRATADETEHRVARGAAARFSASGRFAAFLINPMKGEVSRAKREKRRTTPRDSLGVLDLRTGQLVRIAEVKSFQMPEKGEGWLAYLLEREANEGAATTANAPAAGSPAQPRANPSEGNTLVLRNLASGAERKIEHVTAYAFSDDGRRLAYTASAKDSAANGVYVTELATGALTPVLTGAGSYRSLAWDDRGEQLAFLSTQGDAAAKQPGYALYSWRAGEKAARRVAAAGSAGIPAGWQPSEFGALRFSPNGQRLFFGTAPRPEPEPTDTLLPEDRVKVDIWHWQDPQIQPTQLKRVAQERRRNFQAVVHLREGRITQLADEALPQVTVGTRGDADVAIGSASEPYALQNGWDTPGYADVYLVDVKSGKRERIREKAQGNATLSPGARYAFWYDYPTHAWVTLDVKSKKTATLSSGIPFPLEDEEHDSPSLPSPYGVAGWTEGDAAFIISDRFDLWALDPSGKSAPRNVTGGAGRRENLRFRFLSLEGGAGMGRGRGGAREAIDPKAPLLLSAFNPKSKDTGFYRVQLQGTGAPERLVLTDRAFSSPQKAANADIVLFTRESFEETPNLWVAGLDFQNPRRISNANPQQGEYLWGSAELVEWTSTDGVPLQGVLYKPENLDPNKTYPMVVYFYERMSDGLHSHYAPVMHRSRINFTNYTSRGYLVFVPDIVYKTGYPGESAMNAVMPGVLKLMERPYVDRANIGLQGHSWGGYQIAYMVTKTDLFKAAIAGAPVANMTSAYGGIRWETGVSRQFQYERTQSRLGANLWESPIRYIENSPLFWLDKVETPLLILANDQDGAVPWYQGIELFMGLRRLSKPTWMVNYNDEPHWPTTAANKRDWNFRMQQFFDHYLKGGPAPVWLKDGVPATQKGRSLGVEPARTGVAADGAGY